MKKITGSITAPRVFSPGSARFRPKIKRCGPDLFPSTCTAAGTLLPIGSGRLCGYQPAAFGKQASQAIVVNSGNANACTGEQGWNDTLQMAQCR